MKVLNYGSLNIDHVYRVSHIVRPGETLSSQGLNFFAGGKGANQSVALAKTGAEVWHAGKVGRDGLWLMEELKKRGVTTDLVRTYDGPTGHAIIQVSPDGENSIVLFGGGNCQITPEEVEESLGKFEAGDYLVLQNEINDTGTIMEKAYKLGMKICLNPAPFTRKVLEWPLCLVDILIVNETEAMGLTGSRMEFSAMVDKLTQTYPDTEIIMTVGKEGAYFGHNRERHFVPSRVVKAVDTTAAGDTFMGYYIASRMAGLGIELAMKKAALAASITVSRSGAMDSVPTDTELQRY